MWKIDSVLPSFAPSLVGGAEIDKVTGNIVAIYDNSVYKNVSYSTLRLIYLVVV